MPKPARKTALPKIVPALLLAALLTFATGCLSREGGRDLRGGVGSFEGSAAGRSFAGSGRAPAPHVAAASQRPEKLTWPVRGRIVSRFGAQSRAEQNGIVISVDNPTVVRAAAEGRVGHVGSIKGYGNVALIEHADRLVTVYAHLNGADVEKGATVRRGQAIGTVGNPGRADSAGLYFEVRFRSKPIDPLLLLEKAG